MESVKPKRIVDALAARPMLLYQTFLEINRRFNQGDLDYLGPWTDGQRLNIFGHRSVAVVSSEGWRWSWTAKAPDDFGKEVTGVQDSMVKAMDAADVFLEASGWNLLNEPVR